MEIVEKLLGEFLAGASMFSKLIDPSNVAFTGPTFCKTLATIVVADVLSVSSHPGMRTFNTSTSLSAAQTLGRGAAIQYSPVISIGDQIIRQNEQTQIVGAARYKASLMTE